MSISEPSIREVPRKLRFACACASAVVADDDPWVPIPRAGKLNDGTKELILNAIYRQPRTGTQLAELLGLSPPAVHRHIKEMLGSELIREVEVSPEERVWSVELYYAPNFPVVLATDRQRLAAALDRLADAIVRTFGEQQPELREAFSRTSLADRGQSFDDVLHYLYISALRLARQRLQENGLLPVPPLHRDGSRWLWWAEEAPRGEEE